MKSYILNWTVGYTASASTSPLEMYPAHVPGTVQLDYAAAHNWDAYYKDTNFKDYGWMEDVYWLYQTTLDFTLSNAQCATLLFKGIDYKYEISADGEVLCKGEGMFSSVKVDVTKFSGKPTVLSVLIFPAPKDDDSGTRSQAKRSCKSPACYGWDWHPRLISAGLWDDAILLIQDMPCISDLDLSYRLHQPLDRCDITVTVTFGNESSSFQMSQTEQNDSECIGAQHKIKLALTLENEIVKEIILPISSYKETYFLTLENPKLWQPTGYGKQPIYLFTVSTLDVDGTVTDTSSRKIGFRRSKLVMNEGSWDEPNAFPKSRSDAPATFCINGQKIFAKGSNLVNTQIFPGEMTEEHYDQLLTLVKDAHMNILRIWGGGFINKESFYDLCDEKGIMVWQEFPLACNEYPDDEGYLSVLKQEATAIVKRLRTHPCLVLWCGGNELFNNWSKMTDQHHALRLLDSICYQEDPDTPYIMTSPLNGMAHGHYMNYDEETGTEFISLLTHSTNTAYTEFGCPGVSDPEYIKSFMSKEDYENWGDNNAVWVGHHGFHAWRTNCWVRIPEVEYFYGSYENKEDLFKKTSFLQCMGYRSCFEEMRKQWPHCSMALNWCLNEPWPTIGNNSLISWPASPKPAYYAVKSALRPTLASLRINHHLWHGGDVFRAEIWMLHDSLETLASGSIMVSYYLKETGQISFEDTSTLWGTVYYTPLAPQTNFRIGDLTFLIPDEFEGEMHIKLDVTDHPEMSSEYTYLCRKNEAVSTEGMLNV